MHACSLGRSTGPPSARPQLSQALHLLEQPCFQAPCPSFHRHDQTPASRETCFLLQQGSRSLPPGPPRGKQARASEAGKNPTRPAPQIKATRVTAGPCESQEGQSRPGQPCQDPQGRQGRKRFLLLLLLIRMDTSLPGQERTRPAREAGSGLHAQKHPGGTGRSVTKSFATACEGGKAVQGLGKP